MIVNLAPLTQALLRRLATGAAALLISAPLMAQFSWLPDSWQPSQLELGAGLGAQAVNDWRGSGENQVNALPLPYINYQSDFLELSPDAAKGRLVSNERFEFSISADVSYTEDSRNNPLRDGMQPLSPTFELGPSLEYNLTGADRDRGWEVRLPLRAVFAVDMPDVQQVGWIANPKLTWRNPELLTDAEVQFDVGLVWADTEYNSYIYGVPVADAQPGRPAFDAKSGYGGSFVKLGYERRSGPWWFKLTARYDYLGGTANDNSPLFETNDYFVVNAGVARVFWSY